MESCKMSVNIEIIVNSLLESVKFAANLLLNATQQKMVSEIVDDVEMYVALLGRAVSRYQTVSEIVKTAHKEGRDLTDEEMVKIHDMYDDMLSNAMSEKQNEKQ